MAEEKTTDTAAQILKASTKTGEWDRELVDAIIDGTEFEKVEKIDTKRGKNDKAWVFTSWRDLWVKVAQNTVLPIKDATPRRIQGAYDGIPYTVEIVKADSKFPVIRVVSIEPVKPQVRIGYLVVDKNRVRILVSTRPITEGMPIIKVLVAARKALQAAVKVEDTKAATKAKEKPLLKTEESKEVATPEHKPPAKAKPRRRARAGGAQKKAAEIVAKADMALKK